MFEILYTELKHFEHECVNFCFMVVLVTTEIPYAAVCRTFISKGLSDLIVFY